MEVGTGVVLTVVGLLLLCFGGYALVSGGVAIAKKFRISSLIIGLTIVAYGTSTPELAVSVASAFQGETDLILGNVIGSNIANIGMVIGISAIAAPLLITKGRLIMDKNTIKIWIPIMLGVSALLIILTIVEKNNISREAGYLFIVVLIGLSFFTFYRAKKQRREKDVLMGKEPKIDVIKKEEEVGALPKHNLQEWKEHGEKIGYYETVERKVDKGIAESLGISTTVIGIVIVAIGTSLPELVTSIIALRKGQANIGIGNIIGSNIYNILLILGVSSIIAGNLSTASLFGPTQVQNLVPNDFILMIVFSAAILIAYKKGVIPWWGGLVLAAFYTMYLIRTSLGLA